MKLKKSIIEFSPAEVQEILAICLDNDRDKALEFIRNVLGKRVEKQLQDK